MRTRGRIAGVVVGLLAMLGTTVATAGAATAAVDQGPAVAPAQSYYWEWTDGSNKNRRYFYRSDYGVESNLPGLRVRVRPLFPQRTVKLQYFSKQSDRWVTEDGPELTNPQTGNAVVRLNADNCNGQWCNGTYRYRLMAASKTEYFRITFVRD